VRQFGPLAFEPDTRTPPERVWGKGGVSGTLMCGRLRRLCCEGSASQTHGRTKSSSRVRVVETLAKRGFFYDAAFAHTMMRGLVVASLGQVTVLSLIKVTGILRGPPLFGL
jgi:hypothetical protein